MKMFSKIGLATLVSVFLSGIAFADPDPVASALATQIYCGALNTATPLTEIQAAQQAATQMGLSAGTEVSVNRAACAVADSAERAGAAGGDAVGAGVATFSVTTAAAIVGGVLVLAAVAGSGGSGDDTPASP